MELSKAILAQYAFVVAVNAELMNDDVPAKLPGLRAGGFQAGCAEGIPVKEKLAATGSGSA